MRTVVASIEFPAKVENPNRALQLIGGPSAVVRAIETNGEEPLELRLRSQDPFQHPISSRVARHTDILLRVRVSKRILQEAKNDIRLALKMMHGRNIPYSADPAHICDPVFKFREMADFQWCTGDSQFADKMKSSIYAGNLDAIKQFTFQGIESLPKNHIDLLPPPRFSPLHYPFPYSYRQNAGIVVIEDEATGERKMTNRLLPQRLDSVILAFDDPAPTSRNEKLKEPKDALKECVDILEAFFNKRPLATKKVVESIVPERLRTQIRFALPYVVYYFKSGPYRASYVKIGVDPRTSREYAQYQVEHFRIPKELSGSGRRSGYIFDGKTIPSSAGIQLRDITDRQIAAMIRNARLRETIDFNDGWFVNEDIQIIRRVTRYKLVTIMEGHEPDLEEVQRIIRSVEKGAEESEEDEDYEEEDEEYQSAAEDEDAMDVDG